MFGQFFLWGLAHFFGMGAITFLDRDYPYLDTVLEPSIFYLLGIKDHVTQYPFEDVEWPEDEEEEIIKEEEVVKNDDEDKKEEKKEPKPDTVGDIDSDTEPIPF